MDKEALSLWLKNRARDLGFEAVGIARAAFLDGYADRLEQWLRKGMHGGMGYMENYFDKRLDPRKLLPGAKSVAVLLYNYYPAEKLPRENNYVLSKYAYGTDYHFVIKDKLKTLINELKEKTGDIHIRPFVDSAPVLERAWAERAGLGWTGKNANFIIPKKGSFFFISELITDLELTYDQPKINDLCGACRNCIDACPTGAIVEAGTVDARKCISYLTIELKKEIPETFSGQFRDRIFGCDICQDVCPWTRFAKPHHEPAFAPNDDLKNMDKQDWESLSESQFKNIFKKSAVKRTKYTGLMRNIHFVK